MRRYRFLLSWRWLGLTLLGVALVVAFIELGFWQHGRYEDRSANNDRILAASEDGSPADVSQVLSTDEKPGDDAMWTKVEATGRFDAAGQILIRNRTVESQTGYEVVTPLTLSDGTVLLVDRGWVPPADSGATEAPDVPAPPEGTVTVVGSVRASEGELGKVDKVSNTRQARSINVPKLSKHLDGPVLPAYVTQHEPAKGFSAIPVTTQRAWQNFAYAYQWWLFALMMPVGLVMIARREASNSPSAQPSTATAA